MSLPEDFLWGFATASYQIEGAHDFDGRLPSIWDTFCRLPGKIADGSSGDVACDSYRRTAEDIALLKSTGAKAYRFSLAWSRIIPLGGRNDPVNEKGLQHYVQFVDDLLAAGITPFVTLFHWDLPDNLDTRYGGLLNKDEFVKDFLNYSRLVFQAFEGKVKHWITFNEPWCSSILGYSLGVFAPGRCSNRKRNEVGNSSTEPWIVGHNILVAHGSAVKVYRDEFKPKHSGEIGITLNGDWTYPYDASSPEDMAGCLRKLEFSMAWFADPIYHGDYPASMRSQLGTRLPEFTKEERSLLHGSNDFFGMNHYTAHFVKHLPLPPLPEDFRGNVALSFTNNKGDSIGPPSQHKDMRPNPAGFRHLLKWLSDRYGRPKIYVTENGTSILGENDKTREEILDDEFRVQYFQNYVGVMADAVAEDGVDVRGYLAWSLLDNFEWADGYKTRFGCTYVDYENNQKRYPKKSAKVMKNIFEQYISH